MSPPRPRAETDVKLRALLKDHYAFIWRQLRRLGLSDDRAEDAAQQVFFVASNRLSDMRTGSERSFLFGIARRVASDMRRSAATRHETTGEETPDTADGAPRADELLDQQRARALLDRVLDAMDDELRTVFVLFELEEMKIVDIAELLGVPMGTAASRLRRAREEFQERVKRLTARGMGKGATP